MAIRLAILGLDGVQREWLDAIAVLRAAGEIELVAVGHESTASVRELGEWFKGVPVYDDVRMMLKEGAGGGPQVIVMDRPANATLEFLLSCVQQEIGIFSLGPPVESVAEAQALAGFLGVEGPRSHLLYIWPHFGDLPAARRCAQADEFLRPIRFASGTWLGINHALAKAMRSGRLGHGVTRASSPASAERTLAPDPSSPALQSRPPGSAAKARSGAEGPAAEAGGDARVTELPVRSLSVLAWDALSTLIGLMGVPTAVYAVIRGTVAPGESFADVSGAAAVTLRFADEAAASLTLCDRAPAGDEADGALGVAGGDRRELMLWGAGGTLRLNTRAYEFRDADGELIDAGGAEAGAEGEDAGVAQPTEALREFLRQYELPPSPHRGWEVRLEDVAATMEALVVSHRTGQAESPERFRKLRR